ncbi:ATP-dependent DNA ligase [Streptomyces sp. NBC_00083]|uniref:ATP-dependent DNA ligase n=1 Tax=Streptomyces sp. NBC_00083 TaxID=2975647 RepID=UPI00225C08CC|nr:ATP-dependent DNA ligase [Streptomyces sp. NBC_00083]MCX5385656.1 ATP-dependent DNA ligase [Streptomyces sp. NBC_00083]
MSARGPRPPFTVALAEAVGRLPRGAGWAYEPKFDGHRMVVFRDADRVVLQARSGRIVTAAFPDLADAARELAPGTVLDGEVVVWTEGRTDFAAVQRRAAATAARAPLLARRLPASYAAFDLLADAGSDLRAEPYAFRRGRLVEVLAPLGPPLQAVPMTTSVETALTWYETLPASGIEGLVAKRLDAPYRSGHRAWRKLRHTDTREAAVVGHTGSPARPAALVLVLPGDDVPVVSSPLPAALRVEAGRALAPLADEGVGTAVAAGRGEVAYRAVAVGLLAEVEWATTRHAGAVVLRLREA